MSCFCCWRVDGFDQAACAVCGLSDQPVPDIWEISPHYASVYNNIVKHDNAPNEELKVLMERALLLVKNNYQIPSVMLEKIVELNA